MDWVVPEPKHEPIAYRLASLADLNGMYAIDIVQRAKQFSAENRWRETWVEALEAVGLDVGDVSLDDAIDADNINAGRFQKLLKSIERKHVRSRQSESVPLKPVESVAIKNEWSEAWDRQRQGVQQLVQVAIDSGRLWGHKLTAVFRWMGAQGWGYRKALAVCESLGIDTAEGTLRTQLSAGAKGLRGPVADLDQNQVARLKLAAGEDLR